MTTRTTQSARGAPGELLLLAAVALAVVAVYAPMVATGTRLYDNDDFLQYTARQEFLRKSVFEHHTFPLRSHFFGSGYPTLGDPEDPTLNPLTWLLLPFPPALALKLFLLMGAVAAALGTVLLTRRVFGYHMWGAAFAAVVFPLCFWLPWQAFSGNMNEFYFAFLPLFLFLLLTAPQRPWRFVFLVLLMYTILSDGKQALFVLLLFTATVCVAWFFVGSSGSERQSWRERLQLPIWLALAVAFTVLIGMVRILPAMEVMSQRGGLLGLELVFPRVGAPYPTSTQLVCGLLGLKTVRSIAFAGLIEVGVLHVGVLPVLLCLVGLCTHWRRALPWTLAAFLFIWLTLGNNAPVNLRGLVCSLPFYRAIGTSAKYFAPLIAFAVCMGAGAFFDSLMAMRGRWLKHILAAVCIAGSAWALVPGDVLMTTSPFFMRPPKMPRAGTAPVGFYSIQGKGLRTTRPRPWEANTYFNLLRNVGTIDWYTAVPLPAHGQPRYFIDREGKEHPNPKYRGEAYLESTDASCPVRLAPNRIWVSVETLHTQDTVIINQNFHPGWSVSEGEAIVKNHGGLLAVELRKVGPQTVVLRYSSKPFLQGLMVTLAGAFLLATFVLLRWRGRLRFLGVTGVEILPWTRKGRVLRTPAWLLTGVVVLGLLPTVTGIGLVRWRPFLLMVQGDKVSRQGNYIAAAAAYSEAVRADPRFALAYLKLGYALQASGSWQEAAEAYSQAIALQADFWSAHNNLGVVLIQLGDYEQALAHFREALALDPDNASARHNLQDLLERLDSEPGFPPEA